jgi:hypothetical protein
MDDLPFDNPPKEQWAGLDSSQRGLTPTGLQPFAAKSQPATKQTLTAPGKCSLQTVFPNFASAVLNKFLAWQQTDYVLCFVLCVEVFSFEEPSLKRNRNWPEQGY